MIFRGIEYSEQGERIIRDLATLWHTTTDPDERSALAGEAEVVHAFHVNFPGLTVHDSGRQPKADTTLPGDRLVGDSSSEPACRPDTYREGA